MTLLPRLAACALLLSACGPRIPAAEISAKIRIKNLRPLAQDPPGNGATFAFAAGKQLYYAWVDPSDKEESQLRFASWNRQEWTAPVTIASGVFAAPNGRDPILSENADGSIVAEWFDTKGAHSSISKDGGATWSAPADLSRTISEGAVDFHWVEFRDEVPGAAWIKLFQSDAMNKSYSLIFESPSGVAGREIHIADDACPTCGVSSARTASGSLVAFRKVITYQGSVQKDTNAVAIYGISAKGGPGERGLFYVEGRRPDLASQRGIGPVLAGRGENVVAAWSSEIRGPELKLAISTSSGHGFGTSLGFACRTTPQDIRVAWTDDDTFALGYRDGSATILRRVAVGRQIVGPAIPLAGSLEWMGTVGSTTYVVSVNASGHLEIGTIE